MVSDIERRPLQDLEIAQIDPLLSNLHFSMNRLMKNPKAINVWPLPVDGKGTKTLRVLPYKVLETFTQGEVAIIKEYTHGNDDRLDFFAYKGVVAYSDQVKGRPFAHVSVDRNGVCTLENLAALKQIESDLHRFAEMIDQSQESQTGKPSLKAA